MDKCLQFKSLRTTADFAARTPKIKLINTCCKTSAEMLSATTVEPSRLHDELKCLPIVTQNDSHFQTIPKKNIQKTQKQFITAKKTPLQMVPRNLPHTARKHLLRMVVPKLVHIHRKGNLTTHWKRHDFQRFQDVCFKNELRFLARHLQIQVRIRFWSFHGLGAYMLCDADLNKRWKTGMLDGKKARERSFPRHSCVKHHQHIHPDMHWNGLDSVLHIQLPECHQFGKSLDLLLVGDVQHLYCLPKIHRSSSILHKLHNSNIDKVCLHHPIAHGAQPCRSSLPTLLKQVNCWH